MPRNALPASRAFPGRFIIGAVVVVMVAVEVAVIWLMFMDPKQLLHLVALHIWCNSIAGAC
jgi:hypothetical protein